MNIIRILLTLAVIALTTGCASTQVKNPADPLEPFNRGVYQFNDTLDKAVVKPVSQGYVAIVPPPFRLMVSNFFSNLDDILVTINDLLQFKFIQAISDGGRVLVNSTVGLYGVADVASALGMKKNDEDFGQTLGYWGVKSGPYLVIPIFGPSSIRDGVGLIADSRPSRLRHVDHVRTRNQLYLTQAISHRSELLDQEKILDEAAIDRYQFIRDAYLQHRQNLVYDGNPPRMRYDDGENGIENEQTPSPATPSSKLDFITPAIQIASSNAPPASAAATAQLEAQQRPSVHKIWLAQRDGMR